MNATDVALAQFTGTVLLGIFAIVAITRDGSAPAAITARRQWLAPASTSKGWGERFFLWYSLVWIAWFGAIVVTGIYEVFGPWHYMAVGVGVALPCFLAPALLLKPSADDEGRPITQRYWFKANVWIAVISYIGNYFWTHYFFTQLGASYTFKAHRLNNVPFGLFLITHGYFATYHVVTTAALRRWRTSITYATIGPVLQVAGTAALVAAMAYATALTEALTISSFPYYTINDRTWFYTVGSMVYGIYFIVSFPMFARIDENGPGETFGPALTADGEAGGKVTRSAAKAHATTSNSWTAAAAALDSLAACMLVTVLLDLWRLGYAWVQGREQVGMLPWVPA